MNIKEPWKEHPLYKQGKVELVPTKWLFQYYGKDVSPKADLMNGALVDLDALWKNICEEGIYDPLIMRVGINNKKFRLESGNHRIQVLFKNKIEMVPLTVQVKEECGPHLDDVMTDAQHNFDFNDEILISKITDEYMKPSEVFKKLK